MEHRRVLAGIQVAVRAFPGEIYRAPKSWTERAYRKLIYFNEVDKGSHFAAWSNCNLTRLRKTFVPYAQVLKERTP